ncbi:hypothetical protein CJF32_00001424 [Rutstroemia sp. NJR-2017a WRK4]|nr:hypothetical protein CJF32_00001424 [Rutstroemia sp. NJR-2017a WRK4]
MTGRTSPPTATETSFSPFPADLNHFTLTKGSRVCYKPLDPEKEEIRLLVLPRAGSPPKYDFIHVSLLTNIKYEALSYAWGDLPATKSILIDKTEYFVRENLFAALEALRLRSRSRQIWVDALCINQEDFDERNAQVALMSQIYAKADEVVVWLGKAERDYWGAMVLLEDLGNLQTTGKELSKMIIDHATVRHAKFWTELSQLCHRPYWQRLWIIQEVVLASKIKAHCSSLIFDWERLDGLFLRLNTIQEAATNHFIKNSTGGGSDNGSFSLLQTLEAIRNSVPARLSKRRQEIKKQLPLLDLFLTHNEALCSDQRDRFFGLYSLAKGCCTAATPADYRKTFSETISSVTAHHFRRHADKADVIHKYEHFRQTLLRTIPLSLRATHGFFNDTYDALEDQEILKAVGNVRGAIVWLSPPLKGLQLEEYMDELDCSELNLTPCLEDELRYFLHKRGTRGYFPGSMLASVNGICDYGPGQKCSFSAFYLTDQPLAESTNLPIPHTPKSIPPGKKLRITTQLMSSLGQTLHEAKWMVERSKNLNTYRLFLEENGMIGYVSENAKIGDVVVQFRNTATAVILRSQGSDGIIVGRACDLLDRRLRNGGSKPFVCQDQDIQETGFDVPYRPICLRMKLSALRILASSSTQDHG